MKFEFDVEKKCFSGRGLCLTHVGASCCETWLKFEIEALRCREKKKLELKKMIGSWITPLVGRHVVNESKVGCHIVLNSEYYKSDFRWIIHLRLYSGP